MGKKSTGDFPYVYEEENKASLSALPENIKQLEDYLQWEEISKYLLRLLEGNDNKSAHFLKGGLPWYARTAWERDDNSSWKDVSKINPVATLYTALSVGSFLAVVPIITAINAVQKINYFSPLRLCAVQLCNQMRGARSHTLCKEGNRLASKRIW